MPHDPQLDLDAADTVIAAYQQHPDLGFACCSAHPAADAAAAMAAEIRRLRAELATANARLDATARLAGRQETKLRELGAPATVDAMSVTSDPEPGTHPCGHDDYHDPHEWADRPGVWCPGISYADDAVPAARP
ncbi:hypothetical protein [Streptomyces sp. NPDC048521]|uniref:hypothetical protein n=1 Tax=Streptomyces sp. NPDC048521 TaxID=3365566 RepID=UPI003711BE90